MKVKSSPNISLNPSPPSPQKKKRPYYKIPDDGYTADIDNNSESSDSSDELSDSSQPRKQVKHNSDNIPYPQSNIKNHYRLADSSANSSTNTNRDDNQSDNTESTTETPATLTHINQTDLRTATILIRMNSSNQ